MRKFLVMLACIAIGICVNAQAVKVSSSGNVGIGRNNPTYKLDVNGDGFFGQKGQTGAVEIGVRIGTIDYECDSSAFIYPAVYSTFNHRLFLGLPTNWAYCTYSSNIYYKNSFQQSTNANITPCSDISNLKTKVKMIDTYVTSANMIRVGESEGDGNGDGEDDGDGEKQYVFSAEQLREVFPQLVSAYDCEDETNLAIDYTSMIPIMTAIINGQQTDITTQQEAITQERRKVEILQQLATAQEYDLTELYQLRNTVEQLQAQITELQEIVRTCCNATINERREDTVSSLLKNNNYNSGDNNNPQSPILNEAILHQNYPNPFTSNTEISCDVPIINNSAFIYVYNLNGIELMSFPIVQTGYNTITVYASSLSAGMYLYTLVVDGVIVDTKRMILTR